MKADILVKKLMQAKDAYYNNRDNDSANMTDGKFDALEEELRQLDPDNEYFKVVGAVNTKAKTTHLIPMLSAAKGKTLEDIADWLKKINAQNENLMVQPKIDGLSANVVYENGKLVLVATRGDGKIGQDITHVAKYMKIPLTIDLETRVEVRGEIYLPKQTKFPNPDNKPLRNIAVGLVARKDEGLADLKYLHFIAYQVYGTFCKREDSKMDWLERHNFETVWNEVIGFSQLQNVYDKYLKTLRSEWTYETDGLMLTINDNTKWEAINSKYVVDHHFFHNIALKPPSEAKETTLKDIEWGVSRQGKLIPVAIVEPVNISSRMVSRASLTCYENVIRMKFEKGDKVLIEVAGDVIPYLSANLSKNIRQR